ncbi:HNH endonuclease domain-containing protein [Corynebacterium uterequi]|uniref:HNH endonuclease n=1 Tax=Corynebacterium uterequi TaxID=1072256 RepID=A0A0G3HG67_9CORY|nr:HNH endonuclease domain-containing protein [Corynebacterium uterequi]AKK11740.1 HNH endonuclease [Corynebacterium uterequi]
MRECKECKTVKELECFSLLNKEKGYRRHVCRDCRNKARREKKIQNRLYDGARRAREKGKRVYPFTAEEWEKNLAVKYGVSPLECFYTGRPLQLDDPSAPGFLHLDHVKPLSASRSTHSINNVVPTSAEFNGWKSGKRAVVAVITAPEGLRGVKRWDGPVDDMGNPIVPVLTAWFSQDGKQLSKWTALKVKSVSRPIEDDNTGPLDAGTDNDGTLGAA